MGKIRKRTPEEIEAQRRSRQEHEELFARMFARFEAQREHEAMRRARLRRLTFGLLGREPDTEPAK